MFQTVQVVLNAQAKETNLLIPQRVWVSRPCALRRTVFKLRNMRAFKSIGAKCNIMQQFETEARNIETFLRISQCKKSGQFSSKYLYH